MGSRENVGEFVVLEGVIEKWIIDKSSKSGCIDQTVPNIEGVNTKVCLEVEGFRLMLRVECDQYRSALHHLLGVGGVVLKGNINMVW